MMTVATLPAGIVPPRPAWRSLLWIAPLTLLWTLLIYWQPAISASGVPTAAPRLIAYGLIGLGLWLGLESTGLTPDEVPLSPGLSESVNSSSPSWASQKLNSSESSAVTMRRPSGE